MILECAKCGELHMIKGFWHPDLPRPICGHCLGIDNLAEEASYRDDNEEEGDEDE